MLLMYCEMSSSPDTLRMLFIKFTSMARSRALKYTILGLPDFVWLSMFFQPKWNFLNHLITVLWSTAHSVFKQQIALVDSSVMALYKLIKHKFPFLCAAFKSHTVWSNTQCVTTSTTTVLPTVLFMAWTTLIIW